MTIFTVKASIALLSPMFLALAACDPAPPEYLAMGKEVAGSIVIYVSSCRPDPVTLIQVVPNGRDTLEPVDPTDAIWQVRARSQQDVGSSFVVGEAPPGFETTSDRLAGADLSNYSVDVFFGDKFDSSDSLYLLYAASLQPDVLVGDGPHVVTLDELNHCD